MKAVPILLCTVLVSIPLTPAAASSAPGGGRSAGDDRALTVRLREGIGMLNGAHERRQGYDRDKFGDWIDADGNCLDTREEVLVAESRVSTGGGDCEVTRGRWRSYYDRATWTDPGDVDIDHLVPLAEAWDSGARRWNPATRHRYANDLRDRRTLAAVTDNVNQSKGDQDIFEWQPEFGRCRYVAEWVAVKIRWSLRVDRHERRAMRDIASRCRNVRITVSRAHIGTG